MWRRLKNIFYSFRTYADLSPDLGVRQRVNRFLRKRSALRAEEWFEHFWRSHQVSRPVADFVYVQMQIYSGLDFSRVQPGDRLSEDLHLISVCWFDWQHCFCEDFFQAFGIDLGDRFDPAHFSTVEELVVFLNHQLLSVNHS